MKINKENFETFFLLYVDNELEESERKEVEEFVIDNPQLKKPFDDLYGTILRPESISMPRKSHLMHPAGTSGYFVFAKYAAAAVFAGLIIYVGISLFSGDSVRDQNTTSETVVAKKSSSTQLKEQLPGMGEKDSLELASGDQGSGEPSSQVRRARPTDDPDLALKEIPVKRTNEIRKPSSYAIAKITEIAVTDTDQPNPVTAVPNDSIVVQQSVGAPGVKSSSGLEDPLPLTVIEEIVPPARNIRVEIIREEVDVKELAGTEHVILGIPAEEFKKGKLGKFINKTAKILDQGNPINKLLSKN